MKLNKRASYEKRFIELKKMVKDDPDKLLVNIFDEAHHSATSRDRSGKFVFTKSIKIYILNYFL